MFYLTGIVKAWHGNVVALIVVFGPLANERIKARLLTVVILALSGRDTDIVCPFWNIC